MIMVLVDLLVYRGVDILMLSRLHCLMGDGGLDLFVNSRVVLTGLVEKATDGFLGLVHGE